MARARQWKATGKKKKAGKKPLRAAKKRAGAKKKIATKRAKSASNRRKFRRYPAKNLWITEFSGEYRFVVPAGDISEGGIFLKGRFKTCSEASRINIPLNGEMTTLELSAEPIYDRISNDGYGTGYRFLDLSPAQGKALRSFLRNLD